eukprot:scaffold3122_cov136-Isochrysis_galbana.AAC.3
MESVAEILLGMQGAAEIVGGAMRSGDCGRCKAQRRLWEVQGAAEIVGDARRSGDCGRCKAQRRCKAESRAFGRLKRLLENRLQQQSAAEPKFLQEAPAAHHVGGLDVRMHGRHVHRSGEGASDAVVGRHAADAEPAKLGR